MAWGTFFTVIILLYLAYYGIVFLLDMISKGRPLKVAGEGIHYNMGSLLGEEEKAEALDAKSFEEPTVRNHQTPEPEELEREKARLQEAQARLDAEDRQARLDAEEEQARLEAEEQASLEAEEARLDAEEAHLNDEDYYEQEEEEEDETQYDNDESLNEEEETQYGNEEPLTQEEEELHYQEPAPQEVVKMQIIGQPMQPTNFLQMIKEQSQQQAMAISQSIF